MSYEEFEKQVAWNKQKKVNRRLNGILPRLTLILAILLFIKVKGVTIYLHIDANAWSPIEFGSNPRIDTTPTVVAAEESKSSSQNCNCTDSPRIAVKNTCPPSEEQLLRGVYDRSRAVTVDLSTSVPRMATTIGHWTLQTVSTAVEWSQQQVESTPFFGAKGRKGSVAEQKTGDQE